MTALGKLFRTTTFKLTLVYLTVFALFAAFLLGYFALNTRRLITEQITDTVNAEITGLSEQYRQGGIRRLVVVVDARARRPGLEPVSRHHVPGRIAGRQCHRAAARHSRQSGLGRDRLIAGSTNPNRPTSRSITLWRGSSSCRAGSACWSAAISKSASGSTTSCSPPAAGRWRSSSCWVWSAAFLSRAACCGASMR